MRVFGWCCSLALKFCLVQVVGWGKLQWLVEEMAFENLIQAKKQILVTAKMFTLRQLLEVFGNVM